MRSFSPWRLQIVVLTVIVTAPAFHCYVTYFCGNLNATVRSASLLLPDYPDNYPGNQDCVYHITAPEGSRIQIKLTPAKILYNVPKYCQTDYIYVLDGPSLYGDVLARACGDNPYLVVSSGRSLTLRSHSDDSSNPRKFNVAYKTVNETAGCPVQTLALSETTYVVKSPRYPERYPLGVDCEWRLDARDGYLVYLEVNVSNIETSEGCIKDYIKITDGFHTDAGWNLGTWCGSDVPAPIHTSGIFMNIAFHSDNTTSGEGFKFFLSQRPKSEFEEKQTTNTNVGLIVGIVVGVLVLIVIIGTVIFCRNRRNR